MRPQIATKTGTGGGGISTPAVFDLNINPFNIGIGCVVSGTVNYTIQHTFDDITTLGAANCTWFPHDNSDLVAQTANANDNFDFPCTAARILMNSGTGTVTATFIQAGTPRGA